LLAVPKEIDLCIQAGGVEHWVEEVENCKRKGVKALLLIYPDFNFRLPNATGLLQRIGEGLNAKAIAMGNPLRL